MKIAIVDDKECWREKAQEIVKNYYAHTDVEIDIYENGENYLNSEKKYDISLIDIIMPIMEGFDVITLAKKKNPKGIYIIMTTKKESYRKGFLVNAYRYMDKDNIKEELWEALTSIDILMERNEKIELNIIGEGKREFILKNISFVETEKRSVIIHTRDGQKRCNNTMTDMEELLNRSFFFRCHNAYIVNLDEIERVDNYNIYMYGGEKIFVSARKMSDFNKAYLNRQYECANA